jgi:hypothetical protein
MPVDDIEKLNLHHEKAQDTRDDGLDHWSDDGGASIDEGQRRGATWLESIAFAAAFAYISKSHFRYDAPVVFQPMEIRAGRGTSTMVRASSLPISGS